MSTFDGKVKEFPDIRIDHFRLSGAAAASSSKPPLAYFLSHVHSDHLQGLETCKSPFIYCSPATKAILLRLEKYPHRMNFAKAILETRKQTYRHLKLLLKTIPLATPMVIDLAPGKSIRVTLFDANHCVGAVMFLIEGDGKAILYTGDIRSELWWVNNLVREPVMLSYALQVGGKAPLKRLDCIYLDTTFASKDNPYKHFPSKLEGTQELLEKISKYPKDTVFYFDTWTFGYEGVWMTLCNLLDCQVHVDEYRYKLYRALATGEGIKAEEAARLFGYKCGNHTQEGCLTEQQSRLHSCEQGTGCEVFKKDFVRITPIISRHDGVEMAERGAGGGKGDLDQQHELEVGDAGSLSMLMSLCATKMQDQPQRLSSVLQMLASFMRDPVQTITLDSAMLHPDATGLNQEDMAELEQLPIDSLIPALASLAAKAKEQGGEDATSLEPRQDTKTARSLGLPKRVTFPYSRHSSYTELCHLIEAFKPVDVWPCTVDKVNWSARQSMGFLFGHLYDSQCKFTHDQALFRRIASTAVTEPETRHVSPGQESPPDDVAETAATNARPSVKEKATLPRDSTGLSNLGVTPLMAQETAFQRELDSAVVADSAEEPSNESTRKRRRYDVEPMNVTNRPNFHLEGGDGKRTPIRSTPLHIDRQGTPIPRISTISPEDYSEAWKREAFEAALGTNPNDWNDITLVSVSGQQKREEEL